MSGEVVFPDSIDEETLARFVDTSVIARGRGFSLEGRAHPRAGRRPHLPVEIGSRLREEFQPEVFAIYYFGLDVIGHYFTRYQKPERFGDVSDAEVRRYGRVVESYYRHLDGIVSDYMQKRAENETIVILSGHGMDALSLAGRILAPLSGESPSLGNPRERSRRASHSQRRRDRLGQEGRGRDRRGRGADPSLSHGASPGTGHGWQPPHGRPRRRHQEEPAGDVHLVLPQLSHRVPTRGLVLERSPLDALPALLESVE